MLLWFAVVSQIRRQEFKTLSKQVGDFYALYTAHHVHHAYPSQQNFPNASKIYVFTWNPNVNLYLDVSACKTFKHTGQLMTGRVVPSFIFVQNPIWFYKKCTYIPIKLVTNYFWIWWHWSAICPIEPRTLRSQRSNAVFWSRVLGGFGGGGALVVEVHRKKWIRYIWYKNIYIYTIYGDMMESGMIFLILKGIFQRCMISETEWNTWSFGFTFVFQGWTNTSIRGLAAADSMEHVQDAKVLLSKYSRIPVPWNSFRPISPLNILKFIVYGRYVSWYTTIYRDSQCKNSPSLASEDPKDLSRENERSSPSIQP
jgi:hypothetical protein